MDSEQLFDCLDLQDQALFDDEEQPRPDAPVHLHTRPNHLRRSLRFNKDL